MAGYGDNIIGFPYITDQNQDPNNQTISFPYFVGQPDMNNPVTTGNGSATTPLNSLPQSQMLNGNFNNTYGGQLNKGNNQSSNLDMLTGLGKWISENSILVGAIAILGLFAGGSRR